MSKKILGKFNWVDILIIVAVVAAIGIVGYKFLKPSNVATGPNTQKIELSFYVEDTPDYVPVLINVGDKVFDEAKNCGLGTVTSVEIGENVVFYPDQDGNAVATSKKGYSSVKITAEVDGQLFDHGAIVGVTRYTVGHSFTFYAGKAKLYGRISGINGGN